MNTIQAQWKEFEACVISKDAPDVQRREMRIAFYAGAVALLGITATIGESSVSEQAGIEMLQGLHEEVSGFANQLENELPQ